MDCRRAGSRRAPSQRRRSGPTPACAAARSDRAVSPGAAPAAVRRGRSGCGRSRSPDTRATRSRADGSGCSRHRPNIRRCPTRPRPASSARGRRGPLGGRRRVAAARHFLLHRGEAPGAWRVGPLVDLGLPLERGAVRDRGGAGCCAATSVLTQAAATASAIGREKRCGDGRLVVMIDSSTCASGVVRRSGEPGTRNARESGCRGRHHRPRTCAQRPTV